MLEEGEGERDLQREREREKKKKKKKIIRSFFHSAKNAIFRVLENVCGRFHILSYVFIFPFLKSRAIMGSKQDHGDRKGNLCREVSSQSDRGRFRWCEKRSRWVDDDLREDGRREGAPLEKRGVKMKGYDEIAKPYDVIEGLCRRKTDRYGI